MTTKISTANLDATITTLIGSGGGPKATAITYPGNDLAADPAGSQTIAITGTGFVAGCNIFVGTVQATVVTVVSATSVTFTSPALAAGTYTLYVVNPDGGTATIVPGVSYSGTPAWTTGAGTLGSVYEYAAISNTVAATGDGSITYSVFSGTLPTGSTLNTSSGTITGTSPASAGATTYSFVIRATDAQLQDTDRSFSITVNTDVVTWTTPADNSVTTLNKDTASSTTLLATSAAGRAITYTANALPTGLSISGATVTGTPTVTASTTSTFTATAATTGKTATATITWTVSVASDTYFPYTTMLLSGQTSTSTFIADASTNNFALAIVGDTKPNNFNPLTPGYYSNYFDGTGDYLTVPSNAAFAMGTGDFTLEAWIYRTASGSDTFIMSASGSGGLFWGIPANGDLGWGRAGVAWDYQVASGMVTNTWYHVALTRSGTSMKMFVNGTQLGVTQSLATSYDISTTSLNIGSQGANYYFTGYISNARIVKGTAVYTSTFTPPTAPLTAITNTSLLTCQSNRFLDNSSNSFAVTAVDNTKISSATPFVPNTQYAAYGSTYFDGTTDSLTVPAGSAFAPGTGNFTVEGWYYSTAASGNQQMWAQTVSGTDYFVVMFTPATSQFRFIGNGVDAFSTAIATANRWNHFAVVRVGTSVTVYCNGIGGTPVTFANNFSNTTYVPTISGYTHTSANQLTGYLSNLRYVNGIAVYTANFTVPTAPLTAVTGTSLLTLQTNQPASNSMFLDSSTDALAVTRTGNATQGTFSPYGANWSTYLDGSGQAFYNSSFTGANFGTANFTIEMWVLWTASAASNQTVFELIGTRRIIIGRSSTGIRYFNDGTEKGYTVTVPVGTWNHIAIVRIANTTKIYLNGVSGTSFVDNVNWAETQFYVGRNSDGVELTSAMYLSNLRVVNGTAVYTSDFTPPTAPLTAISGTTLLIGKSNDFVDNSTNAFPITSIGTPSVQRFSPFAPQTQTAITHSAYFDGTGDYLLTPSSSQFNLTGDFTIEFWFYRSVNVDVIGLVGIGTTDPNSNLIRINAGKLQFWLGGSNSGGSGTGTKTGQINCTTTLIYNLWYHVAWVRSGAAENNVKLYLNGVLDGQGTGTYQTGANSLSVGRSYPGYNGEYFNGYISNMRIVNGTAVYTSAFIPPSAPLTAIANTSLLTCQSPTFVDNSSNNFTLTAFDNVKPRTVNPFGFTSATAAYSAATYGASAYFDSSGDYLNVAGNGSSVNFGTLDFTIEVWCYHTNGISFFDTCPAGSPTPTNRIQLQVSGGGTITYTTYQGTTTLITSSAGAVPTQQWVHLALVKYSNQTKLYVNGTQVGSTYSDTLNYPAQTNRPILNANGYDNSAGTSAGYLSNLRIVKGTAVYTSAFVPPAAPLTAITNTSLLLNMNSAGVYDSASMNNLETVADAKRVSTHTPYAGSYYSNYFDGTGDYLTVPFNSAFNLGSGNFTIEFWVNTTSTTAYATALRLGDTWTTGSWAIYLNTAGGSGTPSWWSFTLNTSLSTSGATINDGAWHHIALVRNSTTMTMYIDGTSRGTLAVSTSSVGDTSTSLWIARDASNVRELAGYLSNIRIVKGTAVYTAAFTPPTAPLTAIANTSLLTCQSNRLVDNSSNLFAITKSGEVSVQSFNPFQRNSATTLYFDGTGDYLKAPTGYLTGVGTGNFTIEGWFNFSNYTTYTTYFQRLWSFGTGIANDVTLNINASGILAFRINDAVVFSGSQAVGLNSWNFIALVRSSGTISLYLNGVSIGSASNSTNLSTQASSSFYLGSESDGAGGYFYGYINDLRITKGIARYTANFTPPTTAFTAR